MLNFDRGFAFSVSISNLPETKGSKKFIVFLLRLIIKQLKPKNTVTINFSLRHCFCRLVPILACGCENSAVYLFTERECKVCCLLFVTFS
jgi:hypothetical protein